MRNKTTRFNVLLILIVSVLVSITFNIQQAIELRKFDEKLANNEVLLVEIATERDNLKKENENLKNEIINLENIVIEMVAEEKAEEALEEDVEVSATEPVDVQTEPTGAQPPTGEVTYTDERDFLAKLLYCEAGGTSWECQVYTCSAILNLADRNQMSIWDIGHNYNMFAVAYIVDDAVPTQTQYNVIDYVLSGGRIPEICYFRCDYYHPFGTPVCAIDNQYFSKP